MSQIKTSAFAFAILIAGLGAADAAQTSGPIRLARDAASCRAWYQQIQSDRSNYNASCSGSLTPDRASYCQNWRNRIEQAMSDYNSQCR